MRSPLLRSAVLIAACLFVPRAFAAEPAPTDDAALLAAKLAAIDALQREVDQLRIQMGQVQQLMFHVKFAELDLKKIESKGLKQTLIPDDASEHFFPDKLVVSNEGAKPYYGIIASFCRNNLGRVLSDGTLVTVSDRPAMIREGGEVPVGRDEHGNVQYKEFGTDVEITPTLIGSNRLRVKCRMRQSTPRELPAGDDGSPQCAFQVREAPIEFELNLGESLVAQFGVQVTTKTERDSETGNMQTVEERKELVLLITPELVEPMPAKQSSVGGPQWQSTLGANVLPMMPPAPQVYPHPVPSVVKPAQNAVSLELKVLEVNLTKLRNVGIDVGTAEQVQAALGLIDPKTVAGGANPETKMPSSIPLENGDRFDETLAKLIEQGAVTVVGCPRVLADSGQQACIQLHSMNSMRQMRALPAGVAPTHPDPYIFGVNPLIPRNLEQRVLTNRPENGLGFDITLLPRVESPEALKIDFKAKLTEPKPGESNPKVSMMLSEVSETLDVKSGQAEAIPGDRFTRTVKKEQNGRTAEQLYEFLPVYLLKAEVNLAAQQPEAVRPAVGAEETEAAVGRYIDFLHGKNVHRGLSTYYRGEKEHVDIATSIAEINITKLRALGHDVKDMQEALRLLGFAKGDEPIGVLEDRYSTDEEIKLKKEVVSELGQAGGSGCSYETDCPVTGRKTLHECSYTSKIAEDGRIQIAFTGSFTAPKPIPAGFPIEDAKHFIDVREVQTTLSAEPGQTLVVSSVLPLEREVRTIENGVEKISTEEILAVYFITATTPERELKSAARALQPK